jgi:hypothetical protein
MVMLKVLLLHGTAAGQVCCTGGVPLTGTLGLGVAETGGMQLQLTYDHNMMRDLVSTSNLLDENNRERRTHAVLIEGNYGLSSRISIGAMLSFVRQERFVTGQDGLRRPEFTQGVGDAVLMLKYAVFSPLESRGWSLVAGAGPKIPLAATSKVNAQGLLLPADMQPGSGSWDAILWLQLGQDHFVFDNLGFTVQAAYKMAGKNHQYLGQNTYRFGDELTVSSGFSFPLLQKQNLDFFNHFRYRFQTGDRFNGATMPATGGHWLYTSPGLQIRPTQNLSVRAFSDIPVYRRLEGIQLTTSWRMNISLVFSFNRAVDEIINPENPL